MPRVTLKASVWHACATIICALLATTTCTCTAQSSPARSSPAPVTTPPLPDRTDAGAFVSHMPELNMDHPFSTELSASSALRAKLADCADWSDHCLLTTAKSKEGLYAVEGDLRLVSTRQVNGYTVGALQIFVDGVFGAVCSASFERTDADVACRQLGFVGGGIAPAAESSGLLTEAELVAVAAPVVFDNPDCLGTETRLFDCPNSEVDQYSFYVNNGPLPSSCDRGRVRAFVACGSLSGPEDGALRLTGGIASDDGTSRFGRLEVFNGGGWGTVCDRRGFVDFTPADARVVCRSLGFADGITVKPQEIDSTDLFLLPSWRSGFGCTGSENDPNDCPDPGIGRDETDCFPSQSVELICSPGPDPELDGRLRLMEGGNGAGYKYGRLEIFLRGFWSSVCDRRGFTPAAAQVACRALGFDGGAVLRFVQPYGGRKRAVLAANIPPGISGVDCDGSETSLLECSSASEIMGECSVRIEDSEATDATVLACGSTSAATECDVDPPAATQGSVRLRGGFGTPCDPLYTGIVEVFNAGEWGAICDGERSRNADALVADVVCRQLGFPHGTILDALTPVLSQPFEYYSFFYFDEEGEDGGVAELEGERFWLDAVQCRGSEERLVDCDLGLGFREEDSGICEFSGFFRVHVACRQFAVPEALEAVTSPGAGEGDLRLVGQTAVDNWEFGRLEIFLEGSWGQVCDLQFRELDSEVACRQLGFAPAVGTQASGLLDFDDPDSGLVRPEVAFSIPGCTGSEATLLECPANETVLFSRRRFNSRGCRQDSPQLPRSLTPATVTPGLQLACVASPAQGEEGALRLQAQTQDGGETSGILEIFHAGAWGTFCEKDDLFFFPTRTRSPENAARVACRQLGLPAAGARWEVALPGEAGATRPPWLNAPDCQGSEGRLTACGGLLFGDTAETGQCTVFLRLVCAAS